VKLLKREKAEGFTPSPKFGFKNPFQLFNLPQPVRYQPANRFSPGSVPSIATLPLSKTRYLSSAYWPVWSHTHEEDNEEMSGAHLYKNPDMPRADILQDVEKVWGIGGQETPVIPDEPDDSTVVMGWKGLGQVVCVGFVECGGLFGRIF
jgi:hypothetical protein